MVHPRIESELEWSETTRVWELVAENPKFLRLLLKDFSNHSDDRGINFIANGQPLKFETDVELIVNPFKLDFNNRRAMTTLLKILLKTSNNEETYLETAEVKAKILQYIEHVIDASRLDFEVATSDFLVDALAKAVNIHIIGDEDNFTQLLIDYMLMMRELSGVKIFVFAHLRSMLTPEELAAFINSASGRQLNILLIESHDKSPLKNTPRILIDQDLCEI